MNRLYLLAAILSILGAVTAVLILTVVVKGINHHGGNHE